ncbi:MAG: hypothetical protein R3E35_13495 [Rhodocyclaceae bacterium]
MRDSTVGKTAREKQTEIRTFVSMIFNPYISGFYVLELLVLFLPKAVLHDLFQAIPKAIGFAESIASKTDFEERAYLFALVMAASFITLPHYAIAIVKIEKLRILKRFEEAGARAWLGIVIGVIGLLCVPLFLFADFGDPSFCAGCTTSSKPIFFIAYGILAPYAISYSIAIEIMSIFFLRNATKRLGETND